MENSVKDIFSDYEYMLKKFRKNDYIKNMSLFRDKWGELIAETVDRDNYDDISEKFVSKVIEIYTRWGRLGKTRKMDLGLFMIYFIFPSILLTEKETAKELCDTLLDKWNEKLGTNVEYIPYDEIVSSFNDKMFGIF